MDQDLVHPLVLVDYEYLWVSALLFQYIAELLNSKASLCLMAQLFD